MIADSIAYPLRLGTRNSKLALRQADMICAALIAAVPELDAPDKLIIVPMASAGDWKPEQQETSIAALGGNKGLFAKELETALLENRIDFAVHSAKDLETTLPDGLCLAAFPPRDDPRDVFIARTARHPTDLPTGARVGTSSLRRAAQILHQRPDLTIVPFRGNVDTRLRKLAEGQVDATLLAYAGLTRLKITATNHTVLPIDLMLPAVAQGVLALEMRRTDKALYNLLRRINDPTTETCVTIERAFLHALDGSCRTPVAALATLLPNGQVDFRALAATPDGVTLEQRHAIWDNDSAGAHAGALGRVLRGFLPADLLRA